MKEGLSAMAGILGLLNSNQSTGSFGLNGFFQGSAIGLSSEENEGNNQGLMQSVGQSLNQRLGLNLSPSGNRLADSLNLLNKSNSAKTAKTNESDSTQDSEDKKKDRLETSTESNTSLDQIVQNAIKNGTTQQIVVSQDGRFEASIDMRLNADGSYALDLSIHYANAQAAAIASQTTGSQTTNQTQEIESTKDPSVAPTTDDLTAQNEDQSLDPYQTYQGASVAYQRYTSYEQILQTRGFEANIFFEEAKSVAASAEQAYGQDMGNQYMSVAGQVAQEYTLNISISGDDLSNFNQVSQELTQFDDSGTLAGFLQAAGTVLNTNSSDFGAFVDATQSLVNASQQHVTAKLSNFFSSMQDQFGGTLEQLGFDSNYIANLGQDVESDLNTYFGITNNLWNALFNTNGKENTDQIDSNEDIESAQLELLNEQMSLLEEKRQELFGETLPPKPERQPSFQNNLPPRPEKGILEAVA